MGHSITMGHCLGVWHYGTAMEHCHGAQHCREPGATDGRPFLRVVLVLLFVYREMVMESVGAAGSRAGTGAFCDMAHFWLCSR